MIKKEKDFEEYKLIFEFLHPKHHLKKWIKDDNFANLYKEDWNVLMDVIDKIELMDDQIYTVQMGNDTCVIFDGSIEVEDVGAGKNIVCIEVLQGEKITAVYKNVINFIKWYDERASKESKETSS